MNLFGYIKQRMEYIETALTVKYENDEIDAMEWGFIVEELNLINKFCNYLSENENEYFHSEKGVRKA